MNNAPIGIFDSGLGGLTALKAVRELLPNEDLVYFGDTARVPYGNRDKETLIGYVRDDINVLLRYGVKAVVIACNTADSMGRKEVAPEFDIPVIGVVEPAAKKAAQTTENGVIGVISTAATAKSGVYPALIPQFRPDAKVISEPTPLLVPLIEGGRIRRGDKVMTELLKEYLAPLQAEGIDTLVLGCTHYPMLTDIISDIVPDLRLINSGAAVVELLKETLESNGLLADRKEQGSVRYFVSASPESFAATGGLFIGEDISDAVKEIAI